METKIENTVQENVISNTKKVYNFKNILEMNISLSLLETLLKKGVIDKEDFSKARDIIVLNHGLNIDTIYA